MFGFLKKKKDIGTEEKRNERNRNEQYIVSVMEKTESSRERVEDRIQRC